MGCYFNPPNILLGTIIHQRYMPGTLGCPDLMAPGELLSSQLALLPPGRQAWERVLLVLMSPLTLAAKLKKWHILARANPWDVLLCHPPSTSNQWWPVQPTHARLLIPSLPPRSVFPLCSLSRWIAPWPRIPSNIVSKSWTQETTHMSTSRRMNQQMVILSCQGILQNNRNAWTPAAHWWIWDIKLPERTKSQKVTYCVMPFKETKTKAKLNNRCCMHIHKR